MDSIRFGSSFIQETAAAVTDLANQLAGQDYALVVFFSADIYDPTELAAGIRAAFPVSTAVIGCTTAGEIGQDGYQDNSVVAVGFPSADFTVATMVISDLAKFDTSQCQRRVAEVLRRSSWQKEARGFSDSLAFVLIDGLSRREESVGRAIQLMLSDTPVVGGSAGDALHFRQTLVFHEGEVNHDAAVVAIISTRLPFRTIKTHHFESSGKRMVITGARPVERAVTEINGFPAAIEYARIIGIPPETLSPMAFAAHPVVVRIGGQEYVRSIQKVNPDNSLSFYCAIDEGIVLSPAQALNAVASLEQALDSVVAIIGPLQVVLACDCILRNLEFRQSGLTQAISKVLHEHHVMGFSTFGELHMGVHMNQTFTGIAFGHPT